jgi:spermidine/putrescine-binding protein
MAYEIILQAYGREEGWGHVIRMGGNIRNFARSASQVTKDVALGEAACGMAIDFYAWQTIAEVGPDRMGFVLPRGLTVVNPDSIALLKGAPHRELAEHFMAFVLSREGQKLWVLQKGAPGGPVTFELDRLPVIPGLAAELGDDAAVTFDPFTWESDFTYDPEKGSARWRILNDLLGAVLIDTHEELAAAWDAVRRLPPDHPRRRALTAAPIGEAELLALAEEVWDDPEQRARRLSRWANDARDRYREIAQGE